MRPPRVLMIGLDGFEISVAERLMQQGRLPALQKLKSGGATVLLDHGDAKRTGLAWEHVSTGLSPDDAERWAAVDFDPLLYEARQRPTTRKPFAEGLSSPTLVFDAPYFCLEKAPSVQGVVNWGAHDPGVEQSSRPASLTAEIKQRFGAYPAAAWLYGFVWPSAKRTRAMAEALVRAVEVRSDITAWLFGERCPDWQLGFTVISEYHSALEALWHGIDSSHPLHGAASSSWARKGIEDVYEAADRMLDRLIKMYPDANVVAFNMHGMGPNDSDVASMALLPELLYRNAFPGRSRLRGLEGDLPVKNPRSWDDCIVTALPPDMKSTATGWIARLMGKVGKGDEAAKDSMEWMPAARYSKYWPDMPAFALPSFYDGRIRINLKGRESRGVVDPEDLNDTCAALERLLHECRDAATGEPVVERVTRNAKTGNLSASEADLMVIWRGRHLGLDHPELGRIGPLPHRRTGGHTGEVGVAYLSGPTIEPGAAGRRSAFDVVPTVLELLGDNAKPRVSGASFYSTIRSSAMVGRLSAASGG